MSKPKIQPPTPHILAFAEIARALVVRHGTPPLVLGAVPRDVVSFCGEEDKNGQYVDAQQHRVSAAVVGLVGLAVDVGVGYAA
jgi:hypothetical protein